MPGIELTNDETWLADLASQEECRMAAMLADAGLALDEARILNIGGNE